MRKRDYIELPDDFDPTPEMVSWAQKLGVRDIRWETDSFKDYHLARGNVFKDWKAAWRTWMRNHVKFNGVSDNRGSQWSNLFRG